MPNWSVVVTKQQQQQQTVFVWSSVKIKFINCLTIIIGGNSATSGNTAFVENVNFESVPLRLLLLLQNCSSCNSSNSLPLATRTHACSSL